MVIRFFFLILLVSSSTAFAAPSLEDFTRERDFRTAAISPDGHYLAQVLSRDKIRMVAVIDLLAPGHPVVGRLGDRITRPESVSWANNQRLLVNIQVPYNTNQVVRDSEKKKDFDIDDYFMLQRMIAMDIDGKNMVMLMNNQKSVMDNINLSRIHHFLPNDNDHILMNAYKDDKNVLFKVNVFSGESTPLVKGSRFTYMFISDYDGKTKYRLDYKPVSKQLVIFEWQGDEHWALIDKIKLLEKDDQGLDLGEFVGLYQDKLVYRKPNEITGYHELVIYDEKAKTTSVLVSLPDTDILGPITDLISNKIIGYRVDGDLIRYKFFDNSEQQRYDELAKNFIGSNFSVTSYTSDGKQVVVRASAPDNPLTFHLFNFETKSLSFLGDAYKGISANNLSSAAAATFLARDGKKIKSYLLIPKDYEQGKKYPLIIMPHGGPQYRDHSDYDDFAQFLSTRGYIVLKPNFRGSTGYGKEFEEAGYKQWGQSMQDDLEDAVNFMVKKGYADPTKVCIVGGSYGGYAALMGVVKTPDLYRCAISLNGVSHLRDLIEADESKVDDSEALEKYWYQRIGNPKTDKVMLDTYSPILRLKEIKAPVLLVVGDQDTIVEPQQSERFYSAMKKENKTVDILRLKDTGHNPLYYDKDIEKVYKKTAEFLEKYLK